MKENTSKPSLEITLGELPEFGEQKTGEIPSEVFELRPEEGKAETGLKYDLFIQRFDDELLLTGKIEASFQLECVRTLHPFKKTITVEGFAHTFEIEEEVINVTDQLREEIMLLLPVYPVCDMGDEEMTCNIEEKYLALDKDPESDLEDQPATKNDTRWDALDQLDNLKKP